MSRKLRAPRRERMPVAVANALRLHGFNFSPAAGKHNSRTWIFWRHGRQHTRKIGNRYQLDDRGELEQLLIVLQKINEDSSWPR